MNKIMISGYYGFNNAGDEAILKSIINGLIQTVPDLEIIVLSANPKETTNIYGVKAISRLNYPRVIYELMKTDLFISGGGSLLQDVTGRLTIPYYLSLIRAAQLMNVKTMFFSQGVGPINSKSLESRVAKVLKKMSLVTVRDNNSKELLEKLELENVELSADPVFFLQPENNDRIKKILIKEEVPFNESGPWVGVAIRDWTNSEEFIKEIALTLDKLVANYDAQILFIPFHFELDKIMIDKVISLMHADRQVYAIKNSYQADQLLGLCQYLDVMVGMRLHSLIFAARMKIPIVAISYDIKIEALMSQLGLEVCCNTENITSHILYTSIAKVISKKVDFKEMEELVSNLEQDAWQAVIRAADLVAGRI